MKGENMSKTAQDVMTKNVIIIEEDMFTNDLVGLFQKHKISGAPVVNKEKKLTGIVTKTDILGSYIDWHIDLRVKLGLKGVISEESEESNVEILADIDSDVKSVMTQNPITASEDTTVEKMAEIMIDNKVHRLIIMKNSTIVGIVSTLDIINYVAGRDKVE